MSNFLSNMGTVSTTQSETVPPSSELPSANPYNGANNEAITKANNVVSQASPEARSTTSSDSDEFEPAVVMANSSSKALRSAMRRSDDIRARDYTSEDRAFGDKVRERFRARQQLTDHEREILCRSILGDLPIDIVSYRPSRFDSDDSDTSASSFTDYAANFPRTNKSKFDQDSDSDRDYWIKRMSRFAPRPHMPTTRLPPTAVPASTSSRLPSSQRRSVSSSINPQHVTCEVESTANVLVISSSRPVAARILEFLDTLSDQSCTAYSVRCNGRTPVRVNIDM